VAYYSSKAYLLFRRNHISMFLYNLCLTELTAAASYNYILIPIEN